MAEEGWPLDPLEALEATEEAAEIRRRWVEAKPAAYEPDLATSLSNLGIGLAEAGRRPHALEALEQTVKMFRRLAKGAPATYEPDLAAALSNFGVCLAEAGRRPEALEATEQAAESGGGWPRSSRPPTKPTSPCPCVTSVATWRSLGGTRRP